MKGNVRLDPIMIKILLFLILIFGFVETVLADLDEIQQEKGLSHLNCSPDGNFLIYSAENEAGLFFLDLATQESFQISSAIGSALQTSWSADSRYLAFKYFAYENNILLQAPAIFDFETKKIRLLNKLSKKAGIPSISQNNILAYSIDSIVFLTDLTGMRIQSFAIPAYANQTPISPDGRQIIYNDENDQLWIYDRRANQHRLLSNGRTGFFSPCWSPNGEKVVATSLDHNITVFDIEKDSTIRLGSGQHPRWTPDSEFIIFTKIELKENREVINLDLFIAQASGGQAQRLTATQEWEDFVTVSTKNSIIYFSDRRSGQLTSASLQRVANSVKVSPLEIIPVKNSAINNRTESTTENSPKTQTLTAFYFDIPYLHQRYDTPDWFDGNWACGATSAAMCLAYYGLLEPWPVMVRSPYSHISDYGNYICEIYTYNNYTFNIWAEDPQEVKGYGGYGFIVRNGSQAWADTKGYMAEYARKHGLESRVDWSPTRGKLMTEADSQRPFVLLNSLTTAGHYISVIGYDNDGTTVIVNDPYGDKNRGYANYYGRRAKYDWPGYSNGYSNLNTVHCYIYFRGGIPGHPDLTAETIWTPDTSTIGQIISYQGSISNIGDTVSLATKAFLVLSIDEMYDRTDSILKVIDIPSINMNDSLNIEENLNLPDSVTSGRYYIGLSIDPDKINFDMVRENNFDCKKIIICGYPDIYSIEPDPAESVPQAQPEIYAKFREFIGNIIVDSIQIFLDGQEVTDSCAVTSRKVSYLPPHPLKNGNHGVKIRVTNNFGFTSILSWSFSIESQTAITATELKTEDFVLLQNNPNPFNSLTSIGYRLATICQVDLSIYNVIGQRVATILSAKQTAGMYQVDWNATGLPSGIYFYRLRAGNFMTLKKMILKK